MNEVSDVKCVSFLAGCWLAGILLGLRLAGWVNEVTCISVRSASLVNYVCNCNTGVNEVKRLSGE